MSLEEALNANTAALTELIAVLKAGVGGPLLANVTIEEFEAQKKAPATLGVSNTGAEPEKPKAEKPAKAKPVKAEAPKPAEPEAPKVARKDVGDALMALAESKGRDAARALLARFDVKVLADAKPEQYPDIKAAAEKEMA